MVAYSKLKVAFLLLLFLVLQGCIYEYSPLNLKDQTKPINEVSVDFNLDNKTDIYGVEFNPINIFFYDQKVSISKLSYSYPNFYEIEIYDSTLTREETIESFNNLSSSLRQFFSACNSVFAMDLCVDPLSCKNACAPSSEACSSSVDEDIGFLALDYVNNFRKLNFLMDSLRFSLEVGRFGEEELKKIVEINLLLNVLENHPVQGELIKCDFSSVEKEQFSSLLNKISYGFNVEEYKALSYLRATSLGLTSFANIELKEKLPSSLYPNILDLDLEREHTIARDFPLEIDYSTARLTSSQTKALFYSIKLDGKANIENLRDLNDVRVDVRFIEYNVELLNEALENLYTYYKGIYDVTSLSYLSLSFAFIIIFLLALIVFELIKIIYFSIIGLFRGRALGKSFKLALGNAKERPLVKLFKVFVLFFVGASIELLFISSPPLNSLSFFEIRRALESSTIAFVASLSYFLGAFLLATLILDFLKGAILGREYYRELIESTPKLNRMRFEKLKSLLVSAKTEIERASSRGVEVAEEFGTITKIPIVELENKIEEEDPRIIRNRIEKYIEEVKEALASIKRKEELAKKMWPNWKEYLRSELERRDVIPLDTLLLIPHQWRVWAITRYMAENPEEDLVLEGKFLKRKIIPPEERIKRAIISYKDRGLFLGSVLIKNHNPIFYISALPKEGIILNLLYGAYFKTFALIKKIFGDSPIEFKVYGGKYIVGAFYLGKFHLAYISLKDKEELLEELVKTLRKYS